MIIGVDIDGVLAEFREFYLTHTASYFAGKGKPIFDKYAYHTEQMFNVTRQERDEYWEDANWVYAVEVGVKKDASMVLQRLRKDGHRIIINTGRILSDLDSEKGERMRGLVREWLDKHNIPYDELVFAKFGGSSKSAVALEKGLDIHVEDNPKTIGVVSVHVPVVIFENAYNIGLDLPNTYRVKTWEDVYQLVERLRQLP